MKSTRSTVSICNARRKEWPRILNIHHRAVHEIASADYPKEVLDAWGAKVDSPDLSVFDEKINRGQVILVAEIDNVIVGFGELIPDKHEVLAVYVHPEYIRRGIGSAILHELEIIARQQYLSYLQLAASLTAVTFYKAHGYHSVKRDVHTLSSGTQMDCLRMRKELA